MTFFQLFYFYILKNLKECDIIKKTKLKVAKNHSLFDYCLFGQDLFL